MLALKKQRGVLVLMKKPHDCIQENVSLPIFRGEYFSLNLLKIHESKATLDMLERFHARNLVIEKTDISYRVLNHWDSLNLIEAERESSQGWRRFNLIETLWISVIKKCRDLGLSLDQIAKSKPSFFREISSKSLFKFIDYYLIGALVMKLPVFFVIFPSGNGELLSYEELNTNVTIASIQSHVSIFLNPLLNQILSKQIQWEFPVEHSLSTKETQIFDLMKEEEFDYLQILKKKNETSEVKIVKHFPGSIKEHELKQDHKNVSIENHHDDGRVVSRKRTIHKRLK